MATSDHIIGSVNNLNGICGFSASVYMASKIDPTRMPSSVQANLARRTLVEIAYFLKKLQNENNTLFQDIEIFTQSFGANYANFSIQNFMRACNESVTATEDDIIKKGGYDIAMPPNAVAAYLKDAWEIDTQAQSITGGQGGTGNCILGLCGNAQGLYGDLQHWVYRHNGLIYSWGKTFKSLSELNASWKVGWTIS